MSTNDLKVVLKDISYLLRIDINNRHNLDVLARSISRAGVDMYNKTPQSITDKIDNEIFLTKVILYFKRNKIPPVAENLQIIKKIEEQEFEEVSRLKAKKLILTGKI